MIELILCHSLLHYFVCKHLCFIILDIAPTLESPYLAGPTVVSNNRNESWIEFYCQLKNSDAGSNSRFKITFLFENVEDPKVPRFNITGSDGRATLHEKYLVGHMGTSVRKLRFILKKGRKLQLCARHLCFWTIRMRNNWVMVCRRHRFS